MWLSRKLGEMPRPVSVTVRTTSWILLLEEALDGVEEDEDAEPFSVTALEAGRDESETRTDP